MTRFLHWSVMLCSVAVLAGCGRRLTDEMVFTGTGGELSGNWKLQDVALRGDSVILERSSSMLLSKFSVRNFEVDMRLMTTAGAEGSVAFHAPSGKRAYEGYRVMINNSAYRSGNAQKTGSLSLIRNFFVRMAEDGEYFDLSLAVRNNHITVSVNGTTVSEYSEPENPIRMEGLEGMILSEGRLILAKSNDNGRIVVTGIRVRPLPDDLPSDTNNFENRDEVAEMLTLLNQQAFPLIDFHGHMKGTLTMDQIAKYGRDNGFNYGVSPNCGLNFPVTNDSSLTAYFDSIEDLPMFRAMQCEGREWVTLFTEEPVSRYDYIFTDAMTWTDHKGRRMRLWMPDEVVIEDEQQFMEMLVGKIESILSREPVDIYVNPTFLPPPLDESYDRLWTVERMDRVIKALVDNDVALEINARYRIPGMAFIKKAKAAGVKFTFGTNNANESDLGRLEYCLEVIKETGISPEDMFLPKPGNDKKVMKMGIPAEITG